MIIIVVVSILEGERSKGSFKVYSLNIGENDHKLRNQKKDLSLWEICGFTHAKFGAENKASKERCSFV